MREVRGFLILISLHLLLLATRIFVVFWTCNDIGTILFSSVLNAQAHQGQHRPLPLLDPTTSRRDLPGE